MIVGKRILKYSQNRARKGQPIYEYQLQCKCGTKKWVRERDRNRKACCRRCSNQGKRQSEETLSKKSASLKLWYSKNDVWNKGLTGDCRFSDNVKKSIKFQIAIHSPEYRRHLSESLTGSHNGFYGKSHSVEQKRKWSIQRAEAIAEGRYNLKNKRALKGWYHSSKMNSNFYFDSFWELVRMKMLDVDDTVKVWTKRHGIKIEYENGTYRNYVPDFLINNEILEEIKGYESRIVVQAKFEALKKYCDEHKLKSRIIEFKEINQLCLQFWNKDVNTLREEYKKCQVSAC